MAQGKVLDQRSYAWVGRELVRILQKCEGQDVTDLFRFLQERGGKTVLGDLINALNDCGVSSIAKPKKELSEEEKQRRRDTLAKAREAKAAKRKE